MKVTAVQHLETVPATAVATGFTAGVANDLEAKRSTLMLDSDFLLGNNGRVLLAAATLMAGAEHLLGPELALRSSHAGRHRQPSSRSRRRSGGSAGPPLSLTLPRPCPPHHY